MATVIGNEGAVNPNSAAAQGQAQATPATTLQNDDPSYQANVYEGQLDKMLTTVATGETSDNIIKAKSNGQDDNPKKIKMAIEREFWRNSAVLGVWILGFCLGSIVITLVFTTNDDVLLRVKQGNLRGSSGNQEPDFVPQNEDGTGEPAAPQEPEKFVIQETFGLFSKRGLNKKLGCLLLGFFFATLIGNRIPHGITRCKGTRKKPVAGVDPGMEGAQCLDDEDCTVSSKIENNVCARRQVGALGRAFSFLGYVSVIAGGLLVGLESPEDQPDATSIDLVTSTFLGFSGGFILNYYISH